MVTLVVILYSLLAVNFVNVVICKFSISVGRSLGDSQDSSNGSFEIPGRSDAAPFRALPSASSRNGARSRSSCDSGMGGSCSNVGLRDGPGSTGAGGDCATTGTSRGISSSMINVLYCSSSMPSRTSAAATSSRKDKVVFSRSKCIVAGTRMVNGDGATCTVEIMASSNGMCGTNIMNCSSEASVTILGVSSTGKLGPTAFNSSSRLRINRSVVMINGPNNLSCRGAAAGNIVSTLSEGLSASDLAGCVRASTTVGPNGSNNPLMGCCNRIIKVAASGVISRACRNVNFTVPSRAMGDVISALMGGNCIRNEMGVNVSNVTMASSRTSGCGIPRNVCIRDVMSNNPYSNADLGGNSVVARISNRAVADFTSICTVLRARGPKSGVGIGCCDSSSNSNRIRVALRRSGWFWCGGVAGDGETIATV